MYGYLPPISKTIQIRGTRHVGHKQCFPMDPFTQQLCIDTGCRLEDFPEAIEDRDRWQERVGKSVQAAQHDDDDDDI